jgi:hypothetical protein
MNKLSKTMTALALTVSTGFTFGIAHARGGAESLVGEDSGSVHLSRQVPAHWTRYAGPDMGSDFGLAPQDPQAA